MYKGVYVALSGALLKLRELEAATNNLANVSTVGYKKSLFSSRLYELFEQDPLYPPSLYPRARAMSHFGNYFVDPGEGPIKETGNPLDLAIKGEGFFQVSDGKNTFFTRNGQFEVSSDGFLVTAAGLKVLGEGGQPIAVQGREVKVTREGDVYADGNLVGRISLVRVEGIAHLKDSLFTGKNAGRADGEIIQGALEFSNVSPVMEMVDVIRALREFDLTQKMIRSFDELSRRSVREIPRVK